MAEVKTVTKENFQAEVMDSDKPVIVDFWASWCGPCRQVNPVMTSLAETHDDLYVAKVNIDENPEIAQLYGVLSIPTFLVFDGGQVIKTVVGAKPKTVLVRELLAGL